MRGPFHDPRHTHDRAPTLETERLVLRHVRPSDVEYCAAVHADEEVTRHVGGILTREDAWRRAMAGAGFWGVLGIGMWAIERRATGRPSAMSVSSISSASSTRRSRASRKWAGSSTATPKGRAIASKRADAALDWFNSTFGGLSIPAIIDVENAPSIRLAERLGFERLGEVDYRGEPNAFFRRPART